MTGEMPFNIAEHIVAQVGGEVKPNLCYPWRRGSCPAAGSKKLHNAEVAQFFVKRPSDMPAGALALAELEALAGTGATSFLAFLHAGIAGQQALLAEQGAVFLVNHDEGTGNGKADGARLAVDAAATGYDADIVLLDGVGGIEGLEYNVLKGIRGEVFLEAAAVDGDPTGLAFLSGGEPGMGDSFLTAASCVIGGGGTHGLSMISRL